MTSSVTFRQATAPDLDAIVALLADDVLGTDREPGLTGERAGYRHAFDEIDADPSHLLVVGVLDGLVVACLQLTVMPCLTHGGRTRAQLEGVRVATPARGQGIGRALLTWAIEQADAAGCGVVQLTTDVDRPEARRFYESLGFEATHVGLKLTR